MNVEELMIILDAFPGNRKVVVKDLYGEHEIENVCKENSYTVTYGKLDFHEEVVKLEI